MFLRHVFFCFIYSKHEQRAKDDLPNGSQPTEKNTDHISKSPKSGSSADVALDDVQPSTSGITLQPEKAIPITIDSSDDEVEITKEVPSGLKRTASNGN